MKETIPQKIALLVLLVVLVAHGCKEAGSADYDSKTTRGAITFKIPEPAPVEIFWIDSAGNLGLRGVVSVIPGNPPAPEDKRYGDLTAACRASSTKNGPGTVTVCLDPVIGKAVASQLELDTWDSSGTSSER